MFKICIIICICSISDIFGNVQTQKEAKQGNLRFVVVLYRHGDRTPTKAYPKDPYRDISRYWPDGLGELTNIGIQHQYKLGKWFRSRYNDFLPEKYSPDDIYVRSSDKDRALMSAAANLAGLYPPKNTQIWNQYLLWRPIPIHTVPNEEDEVVAMKKSCPKYDLLYRKLLNSSLFKYINDKNKELYSYLTKYTGWNFTQVKQVESLYSLLSIENQYNLTLPTWTKAIFPDNLTFSAIVSHASYSMTRDLARLKNGPFFDYVFTHLDNIINNSSSLKFLMLSGHDDTIVNILSAMKVYDFSCPDFASSVIWELRQTDDERFYVNVFYKNNGTLFQFLLPNCEFNCDYKKFASLLKNVTVDVEKWNKECNT